MRTNEQRTKIVLIALLIITFILAMAAFLPKLVLADGYESYKDELSYRPKKRPVYAYSVRTNRGSWHCPPEFERRECRRIQAEVDRRRAREVIRSEPRRLRAYADRPAYRVDYREPVRAERRSFGGRRCAGYFSIDGGARPNQTFARGSALKEWRKLVRTSERGGEPFMDETFSPNFRVGKCRRVTDGLVNLKRCTAEGTACRP